MWRQIFMASGVRGATVIDAGRDQYSTVRLALRGEISVKAGVDRDGTSMLREMRYLNQGNGRCIIGYDAIRMRRRYE
jgi:hypothetical protein